MIILSIGMIRRLLFIVMIALLGYATKGIAQPDTVKAGSYVISVHDINFHEKEYTIRFWLWFLYSNPDFDFATQLDIPNAKVIDPPEIIYDSLNDKA
mgnify:FL=1